MFWFLISAGLFFVYFVGQGWATSMSVAMVEYGVISLDDLDGSVYTIMAIVFAGGCLSGVCFALSLILSIGRDIKGSRKLKKRVGRD